MIWFDAQAWVVLGALVAAFATLALVWYLFRYQDSISAQWFMTSLLAQAVFCLSYGFSLLVFDPEFRLAFEVITFVTLCLTGPLFLAFAMSYTGRGSWLNSPVAAVLAIPPATVAILGITVPYHDWLWTGFELDPVFGAATVSYSLQPAGFLGLFFGIGAAGVGVLLLVETVVSYGKLYWREATAVGLSTVAPSIGLFAWVFGIGPAPQLNLTAMLFLPHAALDAYAFVGTHMFDSNPTTRRLAERRAISNLSQPVIVVDTDAQIVELNAAAEDGFDVAADAVLLQPVETVTGTGVETLQNGGRIAGANNQLFSVTYSPLREPSGTEVGGLVLFSDVTTELRREQRLAVMNRLLRHNLRNKLSTVQLRAELIEATTSDEQIRESARAIIDVSNELGSAAEKARTFEQMRSDGTERDWISVETLIGTLKERFAERYPEATIDDVVDPTVVIETNPALLELALSNLIENGIQHATTEAKHVRIAVTERETELVITVEDSAPKIPDHELDPIHQGEESALQHSSGIGLWIVHWCVQALNAEISFGYDDGNHVTLQLPVTSERVESPQNA